MKKIAGIVLVVAVLLGAPLAWHYHSPLPFLPPFPGKSAPPPAELNDPLAEATPADGQESQDKEGEPASDLPSLPPPGFEPPAAPEPVPSPDAAPSSPQEDEELFFLEAVEAPAQEIAENAAGPALPPPPAMDVPPPLPVLP